ncbi:hypothetical protein C8R46DRAFT_1329048 [Mycena filopes]|nr:hypothetical protein C8R46DRAFT_1329048 [Mycena filopes]
MPKGAPLPVKVRRPYATQACTICRSKKSKCDGVKPVCGSCGSTGRSDECAWGRDTAFRKPRTEAHFEALRKRTDSLQAYVDVLEAMLAKCVCQDVSSHVQFRPQPQGQQGANTSKREEAESDNDGAGDSDDEIAKDLTAPMQSLKLNTSLGLVLRGFTRPERNNAAVVRIPEGEPDADASYVFLVEGVNIADAHPNIDWSRYLPPEVTLTRREHDKILDLSFKFFIIWCLRVVPSLFLRDMYRALSVPRSHPAPRTPHYSPMLHNALLCVSAAYSDDPYLRDHKTRELFARAAKACLETECKKPDISLVHALAIIGSFHATAGDRILADLFYGMSSKTSMDLGLNVDCTAWVTTGRITHDEMVGRCTAYWTIFSMDVCWALYFGREFFGGPADRRTVSRPPVDPELDQVPWHHAPSGVPAQPNYLTLIFYESSALFLIGRKIIDTLNGNGVVPVRQDAVQVDQQITKIDLELFTWKSQLPPHLDITLANRAKSTPQRLLLHCQYWLCFIALHQPLFDRKSAPLQHSDGQQVEPRQVIVRSYAPAPPKNLLELLETWRALYTLRLAPVAMEQIIFGACTVFMLRALQATSATRIAHAALRSALAQVEQCIRHLFELGGTFASAGRTAESLHAVLHDRLRPIIARRLTEKGMTIPEAGAPPPARAPAVDASGEGGTDGGYTPPVAGTPDSVSSSELASPMYAFGTPDPGAEAILGSFSGGYQGTTQPPEASLYPPAWHPPPATSWPDTSSQTFAASHAFGQPLPTDGADQDMAGILLTNFDYFGSPELWGHDG